MQRETFAPALEQILAPVPGGEPGGPSVRYDPAFLALRKSREEDDASLPMREWERPLTKADWRAVANDCMALLVKSKDLQLAVWLCDAWVRQHQVQGFNAAADVLLGLVERYWGDLHPPIEDGDSEARVAPFVWLNETLPLTIRLHVPLAFLPDRKPSSLNLADWEQVIVTSSREGAEVPFTREQLIAMVEGRSLYWLADMRDDLDLALEKWDALARTLDEKLALDAPSLGKVTESLRKLQRACVSLLDGRDPRAPVHVPVADAPPAMNDEEPVMQVAAAPSASTGTDRHDEPVSLPSGAISSRQEAYRMLEAAAAYLQRTEPHSPTPYLVKRAVTWGQMSLADLMQEILREEGDLTRYFSLLGLNVPRD
ncbi:MAG: type VI secretion system protein TssA [Pseudomonadota bacterium]